MLWDSTNSRKASPASCWLRKHFPLQNLVQMPQEVAVGWWEVRWMWQIRQSLVAQHVQLWKHWCATCGQALSWRRTGPYLLTIPICKHCSFQCISLICWAYISDIMVLSEFRKLWWARWAADHQTMTMTYILVQVWIWEVLCSFFLVKSLNWSSSVV